MFKTKKAIGIIKQENFTVPQSLRWRARPSRLDIFDSSSGVNDSGFFGIIMMMYMATTLWVLSRPAAQFAKHGRFFDPSHMQAWFHNVTTLILTAVALYSMSCMSFTLIKAQLKHNLHHTPLLIFHTGWLAFGGYMLKLAIVANGWGVVPTVFLLITTMIGWMKSHAYLYSHLSYSKPDHPYNSIYKSTVTVREFLLFLIRPTLVHDVYYVKSQHPFRPGYFFAKVSMGFVSLAAMMLLASDIIGPIMIQSKQQTYLHTFCRLIIPISVAEIQIFIFMFECFLNVLAEITDFGDREFYEDWWNCTTWAEFNRRWNGPVHAFFREYIYSLAVTFGNRNIASLITFGTSAVLHEYFLYIALGFLGYWMSIIMVLQVPLISLSPYHKGTLFGNAYFWFGLLVGVPVLGMLYGNAWSLRQDL